MSYVVSASLLVVGLIHLLPLSGVLGSSSLERLYGISFTEPNLAILMRHRSVLFGLLGAFLIFSAFESSFQVVAFISGFASVVSFLAIAASVGEYNSQVGRVFVADVVALVCLVIGAACHLLIERAA
jgi:hypothetical protein